MAPLRVLGGFGYTTLELVEDGAVMDGWLP